MGADPAERTVSAGDCSDAISSGRRCWGRAIVKDLHVDLAQLETRRELDHQEELFVRVALQIGVLETRRASHVTTRASRRERRKSRGPHLTRLAVLLFLLSVVPCAFPHLPFLVPQREEGPKEGRELVFGMFVETPALVLHNPISHVYTTQEFGLGAAAKSELAPWPLPSTVDQTTEDEHYLWMEEKESPGVMGPPSWRCAEYPCRERPCWVVDLASFDLAPSQRSIFPLISFTFPFEK